MGTSLLGSCSVFQLFNCLGVGISFELSLFGNVGFYIVPNIVLLIETSFMVDGNTGELTMVGEVDWEKHHQFQFSVKVSQL